MTDEPLGATPCQDGRTSFRVWAPNATQVQLELPGGRAVALEPRELGYHAVAVDGAPPGTRYRYRVNGRSLPDPCSRSQPEGVHGPSQVVDLRAHAWGDAAWTGIPLEEWVLWEVHVGAASPEGTFAGLRPHLPRLRRLGITTLELLPVNQTPGRFNWGYDGVQPFAVETAYGTARELQELIDAAHQEGLAVVMDVVMNHLGPEGNYIAAYGPYLHSGQHTPWGACPDLDGPQAHAMRRYWTELALMWLDEFHIDGLRLDAIDTLVDRSAERGEPSFLTELSQAWAARAEALGRQAFLIGEIGRGDARFLTPAAEGGFGLDAVWCDDLHHALHACLTGERAGYFRDFGAPSQVARTFREGFVGRPARARPAVPPNDTAEGPTDPDPEPEQTVAWKHAPPDLEVAPRRLVVCSQNHDQVGNRPGSTRLLDVVGPEACRLAAAVTILSPFTPLLFMGEEYGERAPFPFFAEFHDDRLNRGVHRGRRQELLGAGWGRGLRVPRPSASSTFEAARLRSPDPVEGPRWEAWYRALLDLRRRLRPHGRPEVHQLADAPEFRALWSAGAERLAAVFHLSSSPAAHGPPDGSWRPLLDVREPGFGGPGVERPAPFQVSVWEEAQ
jgi:maltooligosyltrehalose trehalohydrolase